jgi:hypothetical protein
MLVSLMAPWPRRFLTASSNRWESSSNIEEGPG